MTQWFIHDGKSARGPVTERQLAELAKGGKIELSTYVLSPTKTQKNWKKAESIPVLAAIIQHSNAVITSRPQRVTAQIVTDQPVINQTAVVHQVPVVEIRKENNSLGISSIVVGCMSLFLMWIPILPAGLGLLAMILGFLGVFQSFDRQFRGIGFAATGLIIGSVMPLVYFAGLALLFFGKVVAN